VDKQAVKIALVVGLGLGMLWWFAHNAAASTAPPGYQAFTVTPGLFDTPATAAGKIAFMMQPGAVWMAATRSAPTLQPVAISVPVGANPLLIDGAIVGTTIAMQYRDAGGNVQNTVVAVA
jgi:hypothetical protein